jgi:hydrogenase nickel incorporation protein HypA/HybF
MHELSIAQSIIDIALKEMQKANANHIREIELEIGNLAGIDYKSLEFALDVSIKNSPLEKAKILIFKPKGRAICLDCKHSFPCSNYIVECPECKSFHCKIAQGRELRVKSISVE